MDELIATVEDPRGVQVATKGVTTEMLISRQAQEVQAAIAIAKRFPRDQVEAYNRVINACKRKKLAENAIYEFPRGGEKVSGPSIRLAEAIAQNWGNIDFGITELEQKDGESQVMAYAWDLETNTRQTKIFTVKHKRHTKRGDYDLSDPRDIYELVANNGARRLRSCILGVVPGDVVEAAMNQCNKTLSDEYEGAPIIDTVRSVARTMKDEFGITLEQIERYIGWKAESFSMQDLIRLKKVYNSLKDGMAKKEDVFDMKASADDGQPIDAFAQVETAQEKPKKAPAKKQSAKNQEAKAEPKVQEQKEKEEPQPTEDEFVVYERMIAEAEQSELPWN